MENEYNVNRYERTRVLVEGNPAVAQAIAEEIEEVCHVEVLDAPREELVVLRVRESAQNSLFILGEALITTCRVRLGGVIGNGYVMGSHRNLARNLAVIDAAFSSGKPFKRMGKWEQRIRKESHRLCKQLKKDQARVDATCVDFATMDGDAQC